MKELNLQHIFRPNLIRLAGSYLAIIMLMSIAFSIVFYNASAHELGRQVPPQSVFGVTPNGGFVYGNGDFEGYHRFFQERIDQGKGDLLDRLVLLNIITLLLGAILSYYLASRALEPIESAIETQSRFASDASHELRTPLAVIQTENEVALRKSDLTLERAKELLVSNLEEVKRLRGLAEGLLRLAREDIRDVQLEPVSMDEVVAGAVEHVAKSAETKKIALKNHMPKVSVMGEAQNLAQVCTILLDNAVKYSDEGSKVVIKGEVRGKFVYMHVKDHGIGIDEEQLPYVFDRFYRADEARTRQANNGYGLGLAIAQSIVEQHGGEISAESALGKGSTFTVKLPLA